MRPPVSGAQRAAVLDVFAPGRAVEAELGEPQTVVDGYRALTCAQIADLAGVSDERASEILAAYVDAGVLDRIGSGRRETHLYWHPKLSGGCGCSSPARDGRPPRCPHGHFTERTT